jgi:prepilin-type N-terminal cleavage/methylation domain-containing protein
MNVARHPAMRGGFTLLELLTAIAIIAILAALLLPVLQNGYGKARRIACANNLKSAGVAFHSWAHDHNDLFPMQISTNQYGSREFAEEAALNPDVSFAFRHFQPLSNELALPQTLVCPADKYRVPATDFARLRNENVSYWVNPAAGFGRSDSPVAGDRNIRTSGRIEWTFIRFGPDDVVEFSNELHGYRGNVLFGDAHVDALDNRTLRLALTSSNGAELTFMIPRPDDGTTGRANSENGGTGEAAPADSQVSASRSRERSPQPKNLSASELRNRGRRQSLPNGREDIPLVVTRLDGTVVTSSVPQKAVNEIRASGNAVEVEREFTSPLIAFAQWLTRASASATYWLLGLLLLALIAFEVARRRGQRKRRSRE